ncbi:MAG TPA: hypothetical protein PLZ38_13160 [Spirochaetota bacterium]|nr:hypothetical protein [Spirochaetota bacterium]HOR94915.1 hypothetical protein [Spirochaetota bacterium]
MRQFRESIREQPLLVNYVNLDSAAPMGSAVRIINDVVDCLDTADIERAYNLEAERGNNPIHPKTAQHTENWQFSMQML